MLNQFQSVLFLYSITATNKPENSTLMIPQKVHQNQDPWAASRCIPIGRYTMSNLWSFQNVSNWVFIRTVWLDWTGFMCLKQCVKSIYGIISVDKVQCTGHSTLMEKGGNIICWNWVWQRFYLASYINMTQHKPPSLKWSHQLGCHHRINTFQPLHNSQPAFQSGINLTKVPFTIKIIEFESRFYIITYTCNSKS